MNVPPTSTPSLAVLSVIDIRDSSLRYEISNRVRPHYTDVTDALKSVPSIARSSVEDRVARDAAEPDRHRCSSPRAHRSSSATSPNGSASRRRRYGSASSSSSAPAWSRSARPGRALGHPAEPRGLRGDLRGAARPRRPRRPPRRCGGRAGGARADARGSAGPRATRPAGRRRRLPPRALGRSTPPATRPPAARASSPRSNGSSGGPSATTASCSRPRSASGARSATTAASTRRARRATPVPRRDVMRESLEWAVDLIASELPSEADGQTRTPAA